MAGPGFVPGARAVDEVCHHEHHRHLDQHVDNVAQKYPDREIAFEEAHFGAGRIPGRGFVM